MVGLLTWPTSQSGLWAQHQLGRCAPNANGGSPLAPLLVLTEGKGIGSGEIHGAMVFNRKACWTDKAIPFIKIADRADVDFHLQ